MKHEFVQRSLIGNVRRCLSLEVSNSQLDDHLYRMIYQGLLAFSENRTKYPVKRLFEVCDLISKNDYSESEIQAFRNFHRSRQGFYPVLVGEDSYKKQTNYLGFRANSMKRVDISSFVSQSN